MKAAELRDEILFRQPDCCSHEGDCPICCLPLPHHPKLSSMKFCCTFCRSPIAATDEQEVKYRMKRIEVNCQVAISNEGLMRYHGGKYEEEFGCWHNQKTHCSQDDDLLSSMVSKKECRSLIVANFEPEIETQQPRTEPFTDYEDILH